MNRVGQNSGGACLYIRHDIKYKVRADSCRANLNFESCFIEMENNSFRNILVGVIYRAHTYNWYFQYRCKSYFSNLE